MHSLIERTFDADQVNAIINHPAVYPWVSPVEGQPLNSAPLLANRANVALFGEFGGAIFIVHQPGYYEIHTQVVPQGRGPWALNAMRDSLRWMFTRTDAMEIVTRVPKGNLAARAMAKAVHGVYEFTNPAGWSFKGHSIPADIFAWRIQDWMRVAPGLIESGRAFHQRLETQYPELGFKHNAHPDNDTHDRYVGAAMEMINGGQFGKAAALYNRWAIMADYQQVRIISLDPFMLDIGESILAFRPDNSFEVVQCRLEPPS